MSARLLRLAVIGTAAGAFSGLFGVGGGTIIVPLLIAWCAYDERSAAATSLLAIVVIAGLAAATHGALGNVEPDKAALIGLPALLGVVLGTAAQQRISQRVVSGIFALLLLASAAVLAI